MTGEEFNEFKKSPDFHESDCDLNKKLKKAGWYEERKIDISELVKECEKAGFYISGELLILNSFKKLFCVYVQI